MKFPHPKLVCKRITVYPFNTLVESWTSRAEVKLLIAHCPTLPGHVDPVSIVDHGTLIINDANVMVTDDQGREQ